MSAGFLVYQIVVGLALLVVGPAVALLRRGEWRERTGGGDPPPRPGTLWIHAASLGEFEAVAPIVDAWARRDGAERLLVTCTNPTARRRLEERLPGGARAQIAPFDFWPFVTRALARERPACLVLVETEIWPAWILAATRRGIAVAIVNARLSERRIGRYRMLRPLLAPVLGGIRVIGCRSEEDRRRWISIGAPEKSCVVWGNTKYVAGPEPPERSERRGGEPLLLVAGSMRRGEETILDLPALLPIGSVRLLVAPRHLDELDRWEEAALLRGLPTRRFAAIGLRTDGDPADLRRILQGPDLPAVLLLDRMGGLRALYRAADAAFVGGSWIPIGGHNLFEPAREAIPVFFGPSFGSFRDVAEALEREGGGGRVRDAAELGERLRTLLASPSEEHRAGRAARRAAVERSGATPRALAGLEGAGIPPDRGTPA